MSIKKITIYSKTFIFLLIGILLILVAGLRPIGIDRDSLNYVGILSVSLSKANYLDKEPAFWLINELNRVLFKGNPQILFLIFAIIGVTLKLVSIKKLSIFPEFSIFTYLCLYFILHEMTQIRVGVAAAIFLLAVPDIYNRNFKVFLFKTLLAMTFHYAAIIMLLIYFLNPFKMNLKFFFFLPLIGIVFIFIGINLIELLNSISFFLPGIIANKIKLYIILLYNGRFDKINIFNYYYVSLFLIYYIMILYNGYFKSKYDILYLKIFGLMLFCFYIFSAIPVLAFRLSEFLGVVLIILIPNFVFIFKEKAIVAIPLILWLTIYFIFIMVFQNLNI